MAIETITFDTYEKYLTWLKKGSDTNKAEYIANHEREHFVMAKKIRIQPCLFNSGIYFRCIDPNNACH